MKRDVHVHEKRRKYVRKKRWMQSFFAGMCDRGSRRCIRHSHKHRQTGTHTTLTQHDCIQRLLNAVIHARISRNKRRTCTWKETYVYMKRDVRVHEKRRTRTWKETYVYMKKGREYVRKKRWMQSCWMQSTPTLLCGWRDSCTWVIHPHIRIRRFHTRSTWALNAVMHARISRNNALNCDYRYTNAYICTWKETYE